MKSMIILPAAIAAALVAGSAFAQSNGATPPSTQSQQGQQGQGDWMSVSDLVAKLEADGYTIREIDRDDGAYEVEMVDAQGLKVEGQFDRATGEPLPRGWDD